MTADEGRIRAKYRKLTLELIERGLTVTTMESATAGQIISLITDTEGASAAVKGAFVTYSNEAKILQGVDPAVIEQYSVYSGETAAAMAGACAGAYGADIGIGVTGTMGNVDPANADASIPGDLYYAILYRRSMRIFHTSLPAMDSRSDYKLKAAELVADSLTEVLENV